MSLFDYVLQSGVASVCAMGKHDLAKLSLWEFREKDEILPYLKSTFLSSNYCPGVVATAVLDNNSLDKKKFSSDSVGVRTIREGKHFRKLLPAILEPRNPVGLKVIAIFFRNNRQAKRIKNNNKC